MPLLLFFRRTRGIALAATGGDPVFRELILLEITVQVADDALRLFKFPVHPIVAVDMVVQEPPQLGDGLVHPFTEMKPPVVAGQGRITSYNVCYTKLLRYRVVDYKSVFF